MTWPDANVERCRFEANTRAQEIPLPGNGGEMYRYAFMVYLDLGCREYSYGEPVRLYDGETLIAEMPVKGFRRTQLHCMLCL